MLIELHETTTLSHRDNWFRQLELVSPTFQAFGIHSDRFMGNSTATHSSRSSTIFLPTSQHELILFAKRISHQTRLVRVGGNKPHIQNIANNSSSTHVHISSNMSVYIKRWSVRLNYWHGQIDANLLVYRMQMFIWNNRSMRIVSWIFGFHSAGWCTCNYLNI